MERGRIVVQIGSADPELALKAAQKVYREDNVGKKMQQ
jgi:tRNA-dihydrouridine synthase